MTPEEALRNLNKILLGDLEFKIVLSKALEKQIPKKPIPNLDIFTNTIVISFSCPNPNCDNEDLGFNKHRFDCCENCGQKLDWEF